MLIKKIDTKKFENSKDCTVWEYEFPSKDFSYATALIDGRYPEQKRALPPLYPQKSRTLYCSVISWRLWLQIIRRLYKSAGGV